MQSQGGWGYFVVLELMLKECRLALRDKQTLVLCLDKFVPRKAKD